MTRFTFSTASELQAIADYTEDGTPLETFIREQLFVCEECREHFDDQRDGYIEDETAHFYCKDCGMPEIWSWAEEEGFSGFNYGVGQYA